MLCQWGGFSRMAWGSQELMQQKLWRYLLICADREAMPGRPVVIAERCVSTHRECLSSFYSKSFRNRGLL